VAAAQLAKGEGEAGFLKAKQLVARFYADHILAQAAGLAAATVHGADSVLAIEEALL
jgi:3-(methylthio)propanoyl-CoA dehydrogenase